MGKSNNIKVPGVWVPILSVKKQVAAGRVLQYNVEGNPKRIHEAIGPLCDIGVSQNEYFDMLLNVASNLIAATSNFEEMLQRFNDSTRKTREAVIEVLNRQKKLAGDADKISEKCSDGH